MHENKYHLTKQIIKKNTRPTHARNRNIAFVGEPGLGKSWAALKIGNDYYNELYGSDLPIKNVVFRISEFLELIQDLDKCNTIIFDDTGLEYNAKKWYTELNQVLSMTIQSYRYRIINTFFTVPELTFIDKSGRQLIHAMIELKTESYGKFKKLSWNYGKMYNKSVFNVMFRPPPKKLTDAYQKKKDQYIKEKYKEFTDIANKEESQKITNKDLMDMICSNPDKFMVDGKLTPQIVQMETGVSLTRCYSVIKYITYKKMLDDIDTEKT